jgi:hypothetical protein
MLEYKRQTHRFLVITRQSIEIGFIFSLTFQYGFERLCAAAAIALFRLKTLYDNSRAKINFQRRSIALAFFFSIVVRQQLVRLQLVVCLQLVVQLPQLVALLIVVEDFGSIARLDQQLGHQQDRCIL